MDTISTGPRPHPISTLLWQWLLVGCLWYCLTGSLVAQVPAADQPQLYLDSLRGLRVGLVVNHTARVGQQHLVDFLQAQGIDLRRVFAPEHGFRGDADPGKLITDSVDARTGLPIVSLYGANKKPQPQHLTDLDVLVFDIQDVGVRFFTYISTMHYAMEAAAEAGLRFVVLDRPNPLGDYVDGPVRQPKLNSFVSMHPIPIVHGLTVGELALMIRGQGWVPHANKLRLHVVPCADYTHQTRYAPPIKPSPNLPNILAIRLYPSLCLFEATEISIGRGTDFPFQQIGYPSAYFGKHTFVPQDKPGMQIDPLHEGKTCYGDDLRGLDPWQQRFDLGHLLRKSQQWRETKAFVSRARWFDLLAGNPQLARQVAQGWSQTRIRQTWAQELAEYKRMRSKYLLYPDAP